MKAWDYAAETAWHATPCACGHARDQHEVDGLDEDGGDIWGCYGGTGCRCSHPEFTA